MNRHQILLYWSTEDTAFIAEVPELPGCMAHGDTQEDALANVKEPMRVGVDTAGDSGNPFPGPRGGLL